MSNTQKSPKLLKKVDKQALLEEISQLKERNQSLVDRIEELKALHKREKKHSDGLLQRYADQVADLLSQVKPLKTLHEEIQLALSRMPTDED